MLKEKQKPKPKNKRWTLERSIGIGAQYKPNWYGSSDLVLEFADPTIMKGSLGRLLNDLKKWEQDSYDWNFRKAPEPRHTFYKIEIYSLKGRKTHSQICSVPSREDYKLTRFNLDVARLN